MLLTIGLKLPGLHFGGTTYIKFTQRKVTYMNLSVQYLYILKKSNVGLYLILLSTGNIARSDVDWCPFKPSSSISAWTHTFIRPTIHWSIGVRIIVAESQRTHLYHT